MSDALTTRQAGRNYPDVDAANPCPSLTADEYDALRGSIESNGYVAAFPVSRSAGPACEGQIIDGFHRTEVCAELGIEPATIYVACETETQFRIFQIMANVTRRQLATHQKAALAVELKSLYAVLANERMRSGKAQSAQSDPGQPVVEGRADEQAARDVGLSRETLRQYEAVLASDDAEKLIEQIESGAKSIKRAFESLKTAAVEAAEASIKNETQAERELAEHYDAPPSRDALLAERERAVGDVVRLLMEADALIRKQALIGEDVKQLRSRPHTFLGVARRLNEWLGEIEEVL